MHTYGCTSIGICTMHTDGCAHTNTHTTFAPTDIHTDMSTRARIDSLFTREHTHSESAISGEIIVHHPLGGMVYLILHARGTDRRPCTIKALIFWRHSPWLISHARMYGCLSGGAAIPCGGFYYVYLHLCYIRAFEDARDVDIWPSSKPHSIFLFF